MGKGRQVVKPIKKYTDIRRIKDAMLADRNYKVYTLFVLGINLGLRISDLLQLKWKDVLKKWEKCYLGFKIITSSLFPIYYLFLHIVVTRLLPLVILFFGFITNFFGPNNYIFFRYINFNMF